jgi:hypothetical protein
MAKTTAKTTETSSTKSSKLSGKAKSLKQSVKHGAKVLARPFKKLKTSIATAVSSRSTHSRSTASLPVSENDPSENDPTYIESQSGSVRRSNSENAVGPEEELGTLYYQFLIYINNNQIY